VNRWIEGKREEGRRIEGRVGGSAASQGEGVVAASKGRGVLSGDRCGQPQVEQ
jgi:hypothetical protein